MIISPKEYILINKIIVSDNNMQLNPHGVDEFPVGFYTSNNLNAKNIQHHWHEEFELIFVVSGTFQVNVDFGQLELSEGQSIFINAGRLHSGSGIGSEACIIKSVVFHPKVIYGDTSSVLFQKYVYPLTLKNSLNYCMLTPQTTLLIESFFEISDDDNYALEFTIRENLTKILLYILFENKKTTFELDNKQIKMLSRLKKMLSFIEKNYASNITLCDISSSAEIKESECLRCFKNILHTSPIKYMIQFRLEQSANLLKTTELTITAVAMQCGFSDVSYYTKCFKERYDCTPSKYRKM